MTDRRPNLRVFAGALILAISFCPFARGQEEGPAPKISIPGRQVFSGALSPARKTQQFVVRLDSGLYRITYFSKSGPAIVQVSEQASTFGTAAPARPQATILHIVNGELQKTIDLPPTGMCTSDVARDQNCAGEKLHFRITGPKAIRILVSGAPTAPSPFRLLLDPLTSPPQADQLALNQVYTHYLAYDERTSSLAPVDKYHLSLFKGQRVGVLFGSPDFGGLVEVRDSSGALVAANAGFNQFLDPCAKVQIDRLPPFDPLSQTVSYLTFQAPGNSDYEIAVRPRNPGETGLYIVRTFDLTNSRIEPERMRSGIVRRDPIEFSPVPMLRWRNAGSTQVIAYSSLPISVALKDSSGQTLMKSETSAKPETKMGLQASQLSMLYSATIDLGSLDDDTISASHIDVTGIDPPDGQFFLVGFAAPWGACGGGAVDPIAVVYPSAADFKDLGFPLTATKAPLGQFEALLYSVAQKSMNWYFLLEAPEGDQRDPVDLISNYGNYDPRHVSISSYLVDFQIAIRAQVSPNMGTIRVWTRVERRGFKETQWHFDLSESARAQEQFADALRRRLGDNK